MEAPYLTCHNLFASSGATVLFQKLSIAVHPGERWGIVGPNGAGKSTLFKLIQGVIKPESGNISIKNNVRTAFIDQKVNLNENLTVEELLHKSLPHEYNTDLKLKEIEKEIEEHIKISDDKPTLLQNEKWLEN